MGKEKRKSRGGTMGEEGRESERKWKIKQGEGVQRHMGQTHYDSIKLPGLRKQVRLG